ncbi:hypothetical protein KUTeg_014784 [Tegillarca granosa]|uniref:Uncharacterized protein n=1 Tax=Tegillarca granosa TaxID=220873 RepID=A0ABQ9EWA7_TEGGR|nr:hypothetical protein KUTeg_014784 [Tegillarca granosa]
MIENQDDEFLKKFRRYEIETDIHGESDSNSESEGNLEFNGDDARQTDVTEHNVTKGKPVGALVYMAPHTYSDNIEWETLIDYRNYCQEMSKEELDVVIKIKLFHHRHNDVNTNKKKHKEKERETTRVCRETFAFAHKDGLDARSHGNKGRLPKHAITLNDVEIIKHFLKIYGNEYGLPPPGRLPNYEEHRIILLPSDKSKEDVYYYYLATAEEVHTRQVLLSEFKKLWLQHCPHITIMRPATDRCHKCQTYVSILKDSANLSEEEKCRQLQEYQ